MANESGHHLLGSASSFSCFTLCLRVKWMYVETAIPSRYFLQANFLEVAVNNSNAPNESTVNPELNSNSGTDAEDSPTILKILSSSAAGVPLPSRLLVSR